MEHFLFLNNIFLLVSIFWWLSQWYSVTNWSIYKNKVLKENNKTLNFQNNKIKMIRFGFEIRFDSKIKLEIDQSQGFLSEEDCRCNACRLFGFLPIYNRWRIIMSNRKAFASWYFMCHTYRRSILHMDIFCMRFQTTDIATKCQSPM